MTDQKNNQTKECPSLKEMSLFVDKELPQEKARALTAHLETCPFCAERVEQLQTMGRTFDLHARGFATQSPRIQISLDNSMDPSTSPLNRFWDLLNSLGTPALRLASLTALVLIITLSVFQMHTARSPGPGEDTAANPGPSTALSAAPSAAPSAIVKTVDTESSSVMILETEKEKHTIIWFSEA